MSHVQQSQMMLIGNKTVLVEDDNFARMYDTGYTNYHRYHRDDEVIDSALLLLLLRNGWNGAYSEMETTAYIMGWLAAFLEQEEGQLARTVDVCGPDTDTHE